MAKKISVSFAQKFRADIKKDFPLNKLVLAAEKAGEKAVKIVHDRTSQGIDTNGKRFTARNPRYIRQKDRYIKRNYKTKGKQDKITGMAANKGKNWLRRTGNMLSSIVVTKAYAKQTPTGFRVDIQLGFKDSLAEKIAAYHIDGTGKMPKRSFFGFSNKKSGQYAKEQKLIKEALFNELGIKP